MIGESKYAKCPFLSEHWQGAMGIASQIQIVAALAKSKYRHSKKSRLKQFIALFRRAKKRIA